MFEKLFYMLSEDILRAALVKFSPFYTGGKGGSERLSDFLSITQLAREEVGIPIQEACLQSHSSSRVCGSSPGCHMSTDGTIVGKTPPISKLHGVRQAC